jgi:hypothetical protein
VGTQQTRLCCGERLLSSFLLSKTAGQTSSVMDPALTEVLVLGAVLDLWLTATDESIKN